MATDITEVIDPSIEAILENPTIDNSIFDRVEARKTESSTGGSFDGTQYTSLTFDSKELSGFKDFRNAYLLLLSRLCDLDGSALAAGVGVPALADCAAELVGSATSMIKSMNLYINNILIEQVQRAALRGIIMNLLTKRSTDPVAASRWHFPEIHDVPSRGLISGDNPSYAGRVKRRTGSTVSSGMTFDGANPNMPLELRLLLTDCFGYFRDNAASIIGQEVRVEVVLADAGDGVCKAYIPTAADDKTNKVSDFRIKVEKASMWYEVVTPQNKYLAPLLADLNSGVKFNRAWTQHEIFQVGTISALQGTTSFNIPTKYAKFGRAYVFGQSIPRVNSKTRQIFNPAIFDPIKWTTMSIDYNGLRSFPNAATPLEMNFDTRQVTRPYEAMVAAQKRFQDEESGLLDFESWNKVYPFVSFDLSTPGNALLEQTSQTQLALNLAWKDSPVTQPGYAGIVNAVAAAADATHLPAGAPEYVNSTTDQQYVIFVCLEVERTLSGHGDNGVTVFDAVTAI